MRLALIAIVALLGCDETEAAATGVGLSEPCPRTSNTAYAKTVDTQGVPTFWHTDDVCLSVYTDAIGAAKPTASQKHRVVGEAIDTWRRAISSCNVSMCLNDAGANPSDTAVGHHPDADNANVVTFIDTKAQWRADFPGKDMAFAVTLITSVVGTGQMVDADIFVNEGFFRFSVTDDPPRMVADMGSVVTHELGHLLGFDHTDLDESMMYFELMTGLTKRGLHSIDETGLCELYACY
jgi:hypothetical protein